VPAPVIKTWAASVDDPPSTEDGGKMMIDVSTNGASADAFVSVVGSALRPLASSTGSGSSALGPSSEDNSGGKTIGWSMIAMHLAIMDMRLSCAFVGDDCNDRGS